MLADEFVGTGIFNVEVSFLFNAVDVHLGANTANGLLVRKIIASHEALNLKVKRDVDTPNLVEEVLPAGVEAERTLDNGKWNLRGVAVKQEVACAVE